MTAPTARITEFSRTGLTFDVIDSGPLDGDPVVLLHGFPQRASSWTQVAERLHAAGLRTFAPDQRGYSPRARPKRRRDYRITELAADIHALVDRIGQPVHLVGHDWGAAVAWVTAGQRPDLVRSLVTASVPHPAAFASSMVSSDQALRSRYMGLFQLPWVPELMAGKAPALFERTLRRAGMTDGEIEAFRTDVVEYGALPGGLAYYRAIPLTVDVQGVWSLRIPVPTTHVWSDGDVALSRRSAELAGDYVTGPYELVVMDGVTHWIPEQAPEAFAEVVLRRVRTAPVLT